MEWAVTIAAFLASAVEFVEAFTIVLVVGVTINWRSAMIGAIAAAVSLAVIVAIFGTAIVYYVPIYTLRLVVGFVLLLFGLKWLKKAILRYSGLKSLHDEEAIFEEKMAEMRARGEATTQLQPAAVALSFKSVLLEGLEVAFIVITFGSNVSTQTCTSTSCGIGGIGSASHRCASGWPVRYFARCAGPCAAETGPGEYPQIYCWNYAHIIWHVLDYRRLTCHLAFLRRLYPYTGRNLPARFFCVYLLVKEPAAVRYRRSKIR